MMDTIGSLAAMFIDAEGSEVDILKGAIRVISESRPAILLESSPKLLKRVGHSVQELNALLSSLEYETREIARLSVVQPRSYRQAKASNWICLPKEREHLFTKVQALIRKCGLLPCLPALNPLTRRRIKWAVSHM